MQQSINTFNCVPGRRLSVDKNYADLNGYTAVVPGPSYLVLDYLIVRLNVGSEPEVLQAVLMAAVHFLGYTYDLVGHQYKMKDRE